MSSSSFFDLCPSSLRMKLDLLIDTEPLVVLFIRVTSQLLQTMCQGFVDFRLACHLWALTVATFKRQVSSPIICNRIWQKLRVYVKVKGYVVPFMIIAASKLIEGSIKYLFRYKMFSYMITYTIDINHLVLCKLSIIWRCILCSNTFSVKGRFSHIVSTWILVYSFESPGKT